MAITNHERVGKALELLRTGLAPFIEREFRSAFGQRAQNELLRVLGEDRLNSKKSPADRSRFPPTTPTARWTPAGVC